MAGSVNIGNIGATEDAAGARPTGLAPVTSDLRFTQIESGRFAAVATPTASNPLPLAAARHARDIDQSSR